jgi:6-phosphofructo-2-kinase / fructose-2,6-biphosphatase 4
MLIIGHASVIRCLLAYLIGLPASEIPAIEIARGDLLEVVPASYGVESHAYHFWDGPGRKHEGGGGGGVGIGGEQTPDHQVAGEQAADSNINFYENYAEDTRGKRRPTFGEEDGAELRGAARAVLGGMTTMSSGTAMENSPVVTVTGAQDKQPQNVS